MGEQSIDPYLIPGIGVLRNLVGLTDAASLAAAEYALSMGRLLELSQMDVSAQGTVSQLQWIHHYLFQDVYDWAGQLRTVNIEKGGSLFLPVQMFDTGIPYCEQVLHDDGFLCGMDRKRFIHRLSVNYDNFNVLHPFREGNGRAQRFFWDLVARDAGWHFDWRLIGKEENYSASAQALLHADHDPLIRMFDKITKPLDEPLAFDYADLVARVSRYEIPDSQVREYSPQEYGMLAQRYASFDHQEDPSASVPPHPAIHRKHRKRHL